VWRRWRDPIVARRRAAAIVPSLAVAVGLGSLLGGWFGDALVVLGWVSIGPVALALGYGEAFFVGHGRGVRRATLVLVGSAIASLAICALLSTGLIAGSRPETRVVRAIVTLVLLLSTGALVASVAALVFGLGTGYLARKIAERGGDEWP